MSGFWADGFWDGDFWNVDFWGHEASTPTPEPEAHGAILFPSWPKRPPEAAPEPKRSDDDEAILIHLLH